MTTPHADLDALADLLAGEGTPEQAAHLAGCPACQVSLTELTAADGQVRATLHSLPVPEFPADLATRLASLVAAERTASPTPRPGTPVAATVTPLASRRQVRWWPAASGVAAAAALILGAVVVTQGGGSSPDATTALTKRAALPTSSTGNDYTQDGELLTAVLPSLLAGNADPALRSIVGGAPAVPAPAAPRGASEAPAADNGAVTELSVVDPLAPLRDPATLAGCLAGLSDDSDPGIPLALDYAAYQGAPALVVVLPTTKAGKVDVFVVGAGCTQADADLLFFTRLDDPR